MSMFLPECNVSLNGTTAAVRLTTPATSLLKAASTGCVTALWMRTPAGGFDQNVNRALVARGGGSTGGGDGYITVPQAATSISARWRNAGTDHINGTTGLSIAITPGKTYLVMLIVTAANVHLVACEPGGTPIVASFSGSTLFALNVAANFWDAVGCGTNVASFSHYGPIEEVCFWQGLFPEAANVPDATTIQNLANGTTSLATFDTVLTSGVKKCRYRMITADDLTDTFGLIGALTPANTGADKRLMSSGPLRPVALKPAFSSTQAAQLSFATPGSTTGATAVINTPAGTYSGISPVAIQARLLKEDRSVLTTWETVATPSGGTWAEGRFAASQPYTPGWLEIQFKAIDGVGTQLGDIVSAYGFAGTGFNFISESQSQLLQMFDVGSGMALPAGIRVQISHFPNGIVTAQSRSLSSDNPITRIGRGIRQAAIEVNAQYAGVPISISAVGVVGTPIEDYLTGGAHVANWAALKALLGVSQAYYLLLFGHSQTTGTPTTAQFEVLMGQVRTICEATFGAAIKMILCPTARYAGAGTGGNYVSVNTVRTAMRDYLIHNPGNTLIGGSWQTVKNDTSDAGPHPADLAVGHGRSGSYLGYALLDACRAVKQQPLQIKSVTPSGTTIRVKLGPVNAL